MKKTLLTMVALLTMVIMMSACGKNDTQQSAVVAVEAAESSAYELKLELEIEELKESNALLKEQVSTLEDLVAEDFRSSNACYEETKVWFSKLATKIDSLGYQYFTDSQYKEITSSLATAYEEAMIAIKEGDRERAESIKYLWHVHNRSFGEGFAFTEWVDLIW